MAIYKNITSATTTTLSSNTVSSGNISKILISNNSANEASVSVFLTDSGSNNFHLVRNVVIPSKVSLTLEDNIAFSSTTFTLKISNSGTSPDLTVITS